MAVEDVLVQLEGSWRRLGVPMERMLRPGLSRGEVTQKLQGAGLPAIGDVVAWFAWHDGSAPGKRFTPGAASGTLLSLEDALYLREQLIEENAVTIEDDDLGSHWEEHWFPLSYEGAFGFGLDLSSGCVFRFDYKERPFTWPAADSLQEGVQVWVEALTLGGCRFVLPDEGWSQDADWYMNLPVHLQTHGMID